MAFSSAIAERPASELWPWRMNRPKKLSVRSLRARVSRRMSPPPDRWTTRAIEGTAICRAKAIV
jgi:hypothetical protein